MLNLYLSEYNYVKCDNEYIKDLKKLCRDCGYVLNGVYANNNKDNIIVDITPETKENPFDIKFNICDGGISCDVKYPNMYSMDLFDAIISLDWANCTKKLIEFVLQNYMRFTD